MDLLSLYSATIQVRDDKQLLSLFRMITGFAVDQTGAESASIWLADAPSRKLRCQAVHFRDRGFEKPRKSFRYDEVVEGWVVEHYSEKRSPFVTNRPAEHPQCNCAGNKSYRNIMVIPFSDDSEPAPHAAGTLTLLNHPGEFSAADLTWAAAVAEMIGHAIASAENARALSSAKVSLKDIYLRKAEEIKDLHKALRKKHEEQVADLKLAARIHNSLWRIQTPPPFPFRVETRFRASEHLGGDYIDLIRSPLGYHGLVVADISGTGVAACLLATFAREAFRQAMGQASTAQSIMWEAAKIIATLIPENHYVTAVLALLREGSSEIEICTAGHPPPIRFGQGAAVEMPIFGDAIGLSEGHRFGHATVDLKEGERILFYTDGIVEVSTDDRRPFGHERLLGLLSNRGDASLPDLANLILRAGEIYVGTNETLDDQSLAIIERT